MTLQRGFDITKNEQVQTGGVPVVSSGGISSFHNQSMSTGPGVIIGRKGTLGKVHYIDGPYWPHDTTLWVKDFKGNVPRFVYYALMLLNPAHMNVGSASPTLNRNDVHPLPVRWPSHLGVQQEIAEVLGALDDKIAANDRAVEKVTELSAALFARAMATTTRGKVTTISSLSAAGKVTFGDGYRTKKSELSASGFSIIRAADVQGGVVRLHGQDFVSTDFERQIGAKAARAGDVVVTTKGTVGRVAVVPELSTPAVYSPQCCYFRLADSSALSWGFLVGWLMSRSFTQQLESVMHKSDMAPYVNLGDVGSLTLRVPDQAVQRRIDVEQRALLDHAEQLAAETAALTRARDELLPLLMSGKLTVKDAEDRASGVLSQ